ncbi:MAG: DNA-processing protein DprA [Lachnospiraceae bacterium]|nr:DNA-processing protein DprA [Lachnospiraceae bacterium]
MDDKVIYYRKEDAGYPKRLLKLERMPVGLYVRGQLPEEERPAVAIAGARMCSAYGRDQAFYFGKVLAEHGVQIISGLAYGVDSYAHEGALAGGGKTFAVLGCGVNICYPKENYSLFCRILEQGGGVISEFGKDAAPQSWHFPIRNRIISGLSEGILIIEAKRRSGSLITADYALEQGKLVFALPGRAQDELSYGCNHLIYQGAGIAYSPEVILEELGIRCRGKREIPAKINKSFTKEIQRVYESLEVLPKSIGILLEETDLEMPDLSRILLHLQVEGYAVEGPTNYYRKVENKQERNLK